VICSRDERNCSSMFAKVHLVHLQEWQPNMKNTHIPKIIPIRIIIRVDVQQKFFK